VNNKAFGALKVGLIVGFIWNLLSLVLRRAPLPFYDYRGPIFSPVFFKLWSADMGLLLLITIAFALFGFFVSLIAKAKNHATAFSFGFAVLPIAFFCLLPSGDYININLAVSALVKALFICLAGGLALAALLSLRTKPYAKSFWFSAVLAFLIGLIACLSFAGLYDWNLAGEFSRFKIGCALFFFYLWIFLRLSYPDRMDRFLSALAFSLFFACLFSLWVGGTHLAIAFAILFLAGYALAIVWNGARLWLSLLVVGVVVFAWVAGELWGIVEAGGRDSRPNFVVVVLDALRYDAIEPYGGSVATPKIDELASSSVVFERAYSSAPWTLPSVASLFTGLFPSAVGVDNANHNLNKGFLTLAERMRRAGYFTAAIYDSSFILDSTGFARGFDTVLGVREEIKTAADDRLDAFRAPSFFIWSLSRIAPHPDHTLSAIYFARETLEAAKKPFILWIHILDPHQPYIPPKNFADHIRDVDREFEWNGVKTKILRWTTSLASECYESSECKDLTERAKELYLGEVRFVDSAVGKIVGDLKRLGLWDNTVFVLTSDHGEEFGERFGFGHGRTLYEELLRVPLMLRIPDVQQKRIFNRTRTIDMMPTILDLANIPYEPKSLDARSLLPVIKGDELIDRDVFAETNLKGDLKRALIEGDYKIICYRKSARCELFDLVHDPFERSPILQGAEFEKMQSKLLSFVESSERAYEQVTGSKREYEKKPSPDALERLKAMGYI